MPCLFLLVRLMGNQKNHIFLKYVQMYKMGKNRNVQDRIKIYNVVSIFTKIFQCYSKRDVFDTLLYIFLNNRDSKYE